MSQLSFDIWNEIMQMISGCRFREIYHLYCPGCGGTRAIIELLHMHLLKSLYYNPLPVYLLIDGILTMGTILFRKYSAQKEKVFKNKNNFQSYIFDNGSRNLFYKKLFTS